MPGKRPFVDKFYDIRAGNIEDIGDLLRRYFRMLRNNGDRLASGRILEHLAQG